MATVEEVLRRLRGHHDELRQAGIRSLSVFGSVARGEDDDGSDVDLAVALDPTASIDLMTLVGFERRLTEIVGRPVDLTPEPVAQPKLQAAIDRDRRRAF